MSYYKEQNGNSYKRISIGDSEIMQPVEIQNRYTKTIQLQNAVVIAASGVVNGGWNSCDGFDKLGVTVNMNAGTGMQITIDWSFDGTTLFASSSDVQPNYDGNASKVGFETPVIAPYFRATIKNKDATNSKTTSSYGYLKA